eukprot:UN24437
MRLRGEDFMKFLKFHDFFYPKKTTHYILFSKKNSTQHDQSHDIVKDTPPSKSGF